MKSTNLEVKAANLVVGMKARLGQIAQPAKMKEKIMHQQKWVSASEVLKRSTIEGTVGRLMRGLFLAAFGLIVPAMHAHDQASQLQNNSMVTISTADNIVENGRVQVTVHLFAPADPSTLQIEGNENDITYDFNKSSCDQSPCDITAQLDGNVVIGGWNYLHATVEGPNASADSASAQFYDNYGVTDPTTGYAPSFAVHIHATALHGLEVDYAPGVGNTPTYYPNRNYPGCPYGVLTLLTLNRSTLAPISIRCFGPNDNTSLNTYLKTLSKSDLVFASTNREEPLGKLNLAPIGGTDFTATGAPTAYGYSIIGYGAATAGLAVESYNTWHSHAWHGLEGSLINLGSTTPMYGFRSTDAPAFAIQPSASGSQAKITLGYATSFPIGEGGLPPNFTLPSQFTNTTYTSPACRVTCAGGLFTAVFDAQTLQLRWSNTYATNSNDSVAEVNRMDNDLNFHLYSYPPGPSIVIITTVGNPFGTATEWSNARYYPSPGLVAIIQKLGVSPSAFNRLIAGGSFSMIGVPGGLPAANQGIHSITKWYSSTLETGESGMLRGLLLRDRTFVFKPSDVEPFTVDSSIPNPTANQLLSFAIPNQVGSAPSVNWPAMDTAGRRNAYAYASDQMNRRDFYSGDQCRLPLVQCEDIRARYTSSQLNNITNGIDPRTITYPSGSNPAFTPDDLTAVTNQLASEKQYLSNAANYAALLKEINTNGTMNIGSSLQASATNVSSVLYSVTSNVGGSKLSLVPNITSTVAGVIGIAGVYTPAGVAAGVLGTAVNIVNLYNSTKSQPDPEVLKLADLLAQNSGAASIFAYNFNSAVQSSTGVYFNGVYSDWFKLQTIGLMTVTAGSGWYYETVGNALTEYNGNFVTSARTSFYEQIVPQYFTEIRLHKLWRTYLLEHGNTQATVNNWAAEQNAGFPPKFLSNAFVFDYSPTPGYPRCVDYVYMITKGSRIQVPSYLGAVYTWNDDLGTTLMGPAGSGAQANLAIPRLFFYDTSGYAVAFDTNPRFKAPNGECGL